jgi:16S rRNA (uracil1498-N3)-methyltransferase
MRVAKPQAFLEWVRAESDRVNVRKWIAHPAGVAVATLDSSVSMPTRIAVGPEGGFTDEEVAAATAAGWQSVDLGPRILRVETAAAALAAVVALCPPS